MSYKIVENLLWRYTRNACERKITVCQFADNSDPITSRRSGADTCNTALTYQWNSSKCYLTVSISKTKHVLSEREATDEDLKPINLYSGEIEIVDVFQYLGSLM